MKISVIIPCYNSAKSLAEVVNNIISQIKPEDTYEIILINDCSKDNTWEVIESLCENKSIIGINLMTNSGQHAARMAGVNVAEGDYTVFMDDDGQHDPIYIYDLVNKAQQGFDIVYARFHQKMESAHRRFGSSVNEWMSVNIIGKPAGVKQSPYFVVNHSVIMALRKYKSPYPYIFGPMMQISKNIANVDVEHKERMYGRSGYNLKSLIRLWSNGFYGYSTTPSKLVSNGAVVGAIIAFIALVVAIANRTNQLACVISYITFMGFLIGSILMFVIAQLMNISLRNLVISGNAPQYTVRDIINGEKE